MYDSLAGGLENIKELFQDGLIGTNKFRAAVQLMSNEDLSTASVDKLLEAYDAGYSKMEKYFKDSSDGCLNFLNDVQSLNSEWVKLNSDGSWDINFGVGDDKKIADALGLNVETIQSILRKLSDYGFDIDLDSIYSKFDLLQTKAEKANQTLFEIGKIKTSFNLNTSDLDFVISQIKDAQELLDTFRRSDGTVDLKLEGATETQDVLVALISKKQDLSEPSIMSIDTSKAESDISNTIRLLQDFQQNYNDLEIQTAVGADTTQAQTNIQNITNSLSNVPDEIKTTLGFDDAKFQEALEDILSTKIDIETGTKLNDESIESIIEKITGITPEMVVTAGLDSKLVDDYVPEDKDAIVTYDYDDTKIRSYNPPDKEATVTYKESYQKTFTVPQKSTKSHATGTDGKLKRNENAIVNELGEEGLIRNGILTKIIGGMQKLRLKAGDIILNHKQMEELEKNGYVTSNQGRGKQIGAYSSGSGKIVVNGSVKTTSSGKSSDSASDVSKDAKETLETFNWIEKAVSRVQRTIKNLGDTVSSTWRNWKDRNDALASQLNEVRKEISLQQSAYESYMRAAESTGLSDHYKSLVQNGALSIEDIADDTLKEQIKLYQEWYEKALDCSDAVQELRNQLAELAKTKFNNIEKQFDNAIGMADSGISNLEKQISIAEESGKIAGEAFYEAMAEYSTVNLEALEKKHASLSASLQEALNNGSIEEYSDDWFEMTEAINSVDEAILDTRLSLIKYGESMKQVAKLKFDAIGESFDKVTGYISGDISIIEKQISLVEESGKIAGESFYNALTEYAEKNAGVLQQKYEEMSAELQNGIDIGSIVMYDDRWYEMTSTLSSLKGEIIDAQAAVVKYKNSLNEVAMVNFDSLESQFDNAISLITHGISSMEKEISAVEEAGMIAGESYYRELMKMQDKNIQALEMKYDELTGILNEAVARGNVEEYSDAWYGMVSSINSVEDAIADARQEAVRYGESIKEIAKLKFDSLESQFGNAIGLISSDIDLIEKQMSIVEESGRIAGESFYQALSDSGNQKLSALKKEYEDLAKAMEGTEKYSDSWYGMVNTLNRIRGEIMDTEAAVTRYGNSLKEVAMIRIDSIGSQFENVLGLVSNEIDEIETKIAIAEASGYTAGESFYQALVAAETKNLAVLEKEYNALITALNDAVSNGSIQKYDDKWYAATKQIAAVRKAYLNAQLSIARSQKTMRDNAAESAASVRDTAKELFDSLVRQFNGAIGIITSAIGQMEKKISLVEEAGYVAGESFYTSLIEAESAHIASLIKEYETLSSSLNTVEKYSDDWYDMVGNINSVKDALIDSETAMVKYGNALKELEWGMFDHAQESISGLSGESDFIRELMESNRESINRDGTLNDRGLAIQGLHAVNYDIYMRQAQEYGEAIKKLNKEIAEDPGNTKLTDRYNELLKLQREAVLNAEDEKTAIKELVSDGYDVLIGRVNELTDARKNALKAASDLHNYEKTVSEQAADVDRLQKIVLSYQGDDSEGMKSIIQKAKADLVKAQEELNETEYGRYMADQEAMLDSFSDEFGEWVNARLDDINGLLEGAINATNANGQAIRGQINADLSSVGMSMTEGFSKIFDLDYSGGIRDIVSEFCGSDGGFANAMNMVNAAINSVIANTDNVKVSTDMVGAILDQRFPELAEAIPNLDATNESIGNVRDAVMLAGDAINHVHARIDSTDSNVSSRIDSVNAGLGEIDDTLWDVDDAVGLVGVDIGELDKDTVKGLGNAEEAINAVEAKVSETGAIANRIGDTNTSLAHVNNRMEQLHNDNSALAQCIIESRFDDARVVNTVNNVSSQIALVRQVLESINTTVAASVSSSGSSSSSYSGSSSGSSSSSSGSSSGYQPVPKADSYNKSKLNTETSIVDRLKYNNMDSSISERKNMFEAWGGSGTYTGSSAQNEWLIKQMKAHGYKNGVHNIDEDQIAITQEDGTEAILTPYYGGVLTPLHRGDSVLTAEQTENLYRLSLLDADELRNRFFNAYMPKNDASSMMPNRQNINNNNVTTKNDISVSFNIPNVRDSDEMVRFLQSGRAEKIITSIVGSKMMGKNSLNKFKY